MIPELNPDYEDTFRQLLTFDHTSQVKDLVTSPSAAAAAEAAKGVLQSLGEWLYNYTYTNAYMCSQLKDKFKGWRKFLDREVWNCRKSSEKLPALMRIAKRIFFRQKTEVLRYKLNEMGIKDAKLNKALDRFDEIVRNIVTTPSIGQPVQRVRLLYSSFMLASSTLMPVWRYGIFPDQAYQSLLQSGPSNPLLLPSPETFRSSRSNSPIPQEHLEEIEREHKQQVKLGFISEKIKKLDRSYGSGWESAFVQAFRELKSNDEIIAASSVLSSAQVMIALQHCFEEPGTKLYFPYFLGSIEFSALREVLLAKDNDELVKLKAYLLGMDEKTSLWFNENIQNLFQGAIHVNNVKKEAIDFLAERFRFRLHWRSITASDLKDIDTLKDDVCLNWTVIKKLKLLLGKAVVHPVREKDLRDLDNEYELFIARLTEPKHDVVMPDHAMSGGSSLRSSDPEHVGGGIFQIIYGHAFESLGCEDDYSGLDIIGCWSIATPLDYYNYGLMPNFSQGELRELQQSEGVPLLHHLAAINLRKVGLWNVLDFKRHRIFNRDMLKDFLEHPGNLRKLRDDDDPASDILPSWEIQTPDQIIEVGLLNNYMPSELRMIATDAVRMKSLVAGNLEKLGISRNSDWKKAKVYYKTMLKEFLQRPENRSKLLIDSDPAFKFLPVWDMYSIHSFQGLGMLGTSLPIDLENEYKIDLEKLLQAAAVKLSLLGINQVGDFRKFGITDRASFQEFISQDRIQSQLRG